MEPKGSFGPRLRQERERRQISLESIAANTKISQSLLQGLERDDVKRWPSGIFRRAFVRSYAQAVGMDPDAVWREFASHFPDPAFAEPPGDSSAQPVETTGEAPTPRAAVTRSTSPKETTIVVKLTIPTSWVSWVRWPWPDRSSFLPR